MSKFQFAHWCLIVSTFIFPGVFQGFSQSPEDINSLIDNFLKKDFEQIQVHQADTVLTNNLLGKVKSTLKTGTIQHSFMLSRRLLWLKRPDWFPVFHRRWKSLANIT